MNKLTIPLFCFFVLLQPAAAEPNSVVKSLMNEPVSMWDWGIAQMKEYLRLTVREREKIAASRKVPTLKNIDIDVLYKSEEDKLNVTFQQYAPERTVANAKEACAGWIMTIKNNLGIFVVDKKVSPGDSLKNRFFSRPGGSRSGGNRGPEPIKPVNYDIENITVIKGKINRMSSYKDKTHYTVRERDAVRCQSELMKAAILYSSGA